MTLANIHHKINIFLLFILALSGKFTLDINGDPFQIRFFLFFLSIIFFILTFEKVKFKIDSILILSIIFFLTLILSSLNNLSGTYVPEYILDIFLIIYILFISKFIILNFSDLKFFLNHFIVVGFFYGCLAVFSVLNGDRNLFIISGPNVTVRIVFISLLSFIFLNTLCKKNNFYYIIIFTLICGLIATGSRGGIFSAFLCLFTYLIFKVICICKNINFSFSLKNLLRFLFYVFGFSFFLFYAFNDLLRERFFENIVNKLHFAGRDNLYYNSLLIINENLLIGNGLASYYDNNIGFYPHNLFLQLYLDIGIFSLVNISILIFILFYIFFKKYSLLFYILLFFIFCHMFSGSYYDFRYFFIFAIIISSHSKYN